MCSITAIISKDKKFRKHSIHKALQTLALRGPDELGVWDDESLSIGHRRLSVMGLTKGKQPIISDSSQTVVACNGEIYDYRKLRNEFAGNYRFKTDSDSEVLIPLYLRYGIRGMMKYLIGEFAFVLYDKRISTIFAVRDRFGVKPLCWFQDHKQTIIASKAKAIMACGIKADWDNISLMQSLSMHYQPTDRTMFANIRQVEPGHILAFKEGTPPQKIKYWDIDYPKDTAYNHLTPTQERKYIAEFHDLLFESVKTRLICDVPVCCHLSGGLDSSSVAGIMSKIRKGEPVHCFSIVFPGSNADYDEDSLATETVEHIGGIMHRIKISQSQIIENLSDAVYHSEGLAVNGHLSCKYLLNREIRKEGFKVALTGEGADECLAGYPHLRKDIFATLSNQERVALTGRLYQTNLAVAGSEISLGNTLDCSSLLHGLGYIPSFLQAKAGIGYRMYQLLSDEMLNECRRHDFFNELLSRYELDNLLKGRHSVNQSLYFWIKLTLCNYILGTLGDGCEMASSIEGRLPFLDHRLFEYAATLPMQLKIRDYTNEKYILKEAAREYITARVYRRQKHPFQAPPLTRFFSKKDFNRLRDELTSSTLANTGIFDTEKIAKFVDSIPTMSVLDQTIYEPVVMLMLTIYHMNNRFFCDEC